MGHSFNMDISTDEDDDVFVVVSFSIWFWLSCVGDGDGVVVPAIGGDSLFTTKSDGDAVGGMPS